MRTRFLAPFLLLGCATLAPATLGCGNSGGTCVEGTSGMSGQGSSETLEREARMRGFGSEAELDAYIASSEAAQPKASSGDCGGATMNASAPPSDGAQNAGEAKNETITSNQEAGVDEGGIVKNVGSNLVVLRKGRLFVVDVGGGKAPALTDSMPVARTTALNDGVWYDEMLVKGDLIYVIGYRYRLGSSTGRLRGATEIDSFRLTNGSLSRLKSMFLESNDYYSGHNYASRMVGGKLVFYMPHYVGRREGKLDYPSVLELDGNGQFNVVGPIFGALDVTTSLYKPLYPTFHTVVQCGLGDAGDLSCHGRSVLGSSWRETYVSPDAVYLWASSHVYRFDFGSLDVSAHAGAAGAPLDQFSFRQSNGKLFVAVNGKGGKSLLLDMPLAAFDKTGGQPTPSLEIGSGWLSKNRFVGDSLFASLQAQGTTPTSELVTVDTTTKAITRANLGRWVQRIEPLGATRALVVTSAEPYGYGASGLELSAVPAAGAGTTLSKLALPGLREGEGRSHGFFYKPGADGAGTFGYAVINDPARGATWGWGNGISNIGFFDVSATGSLGTRGIVSTGGITGECETSCVDWYGNTRPIFLGDRVFALMGSELAELTLGETATRKGSPVVLASQP